MPNKPKTNALTRAIELALRKADLRDVVERIEPSQGLYASLQDPWAYAKIYSSRGVLGPFSSVTSAVSEVRGLAESRSKTSRGDDRHGLGKFWEDKYNNPQKALSRKLPMSKWKRAKVRRLPGGKFQVKVV